MAKVRNELIAKLGYFFKYILKSDISQVTHGNFIVVPNIFPYSEVIFNFFHSLTSFFTIERFPHHYYNWTISIITDNYPYVSGRLNVINTFISGYKQLKNILISDYRMMGDNIISNKNFLIK